MIRIFSILLVMYCWNCSDIWGQKEEIFENNDPVVILTGNIVGGIPSGAFSEKLNTGGVGAGGSILALVNRNFPVYLGLEINGFNYDTQSGTFLLNIDGFQTNVEMETKPRIFNVLGLFRMMPRTNFFLKPYFDGMFGVKNLSTRTLFYDLDSGDEDPFDRINEQSDWVLSYGGAIGLAIPIKNRFGNPGMAIELKCTYLKGAAADYLVRRDDSSVSNATEPIDFFETKNSATDLILPQIGFVFYFGKGTDEDYPEEEDYD